jgi:hypothetical protein
MVWGLKEILVYQEKNKKRNEMKKIIVSLFLLMLNFIGLQAEIKLTNKTDFPVIKVTISVGDNTIYYDLKEGEEKTFPNIDKIDILRLESIDRDKDDRNTLHYLNDVIYIGKAKPKDMKSSKRQKFVEFNPYGSYAATFSDLQKHAEIARDTTQLKRELEFGHIILKVYDTKVYSQSNLKGKQNLVINVGGVLSSGHFQVRSQK